MPDETDEAGKTDADNHPSGGVARAATGAVRALWSDLELRYMWVVGLVVAVGFSVVGHRGLGAIIEALVVVAAWLQGFFTLLSFERRRRRC